MHDSDTERCGTFICRQRGYRANARGGPCVDIKIIVPDEVGVGDKYAPDMGPNMETSWQRQKGLQMAGGMVGVGKI